MPELPEVETVRRQLATTLVGRTISAAVVTGARSVRRQPREEFIARIRGRKVVGARRWGKFLILDLDGGETLVGHLRMSGQLRLVEPTEPLAPHSHVVVTLDDDRELRFIDPRTFGELFLSEGTDPRDLPIEIAHLGMDPIEKPLTGVVVQSLMADRRSATKVVLLDQRQIAGIGNIYGDEICAVAGVRPTKVAGRLSRAECVRLSDAVTSVLGAAIERHGSSLRDLRYRDLFGGLGDYQQQHLVYARTGEPCQRCGTAIRRAILGGRSAHWCPRCQR